MRLILLFVAIFVLQGLLFLITYQLEKYKPGSG